MFNKRRSEIQVIEKILDLSKNGAKKQEQAKKASQKKKSSKKSGKK